MDERMIKPMQWGNHGKELRKARAKLEAEIREALMLPTELMWLDSNMAIEMIDEQDEDKQSPWMFVWLVLWLWLVTK